MNINTFYEYINSYRANCRASNKNNEIKVLRVFPCEESFIRPLSIRLLSVCHPFTIRFPPFAIHPFPFLSRFSAQVVQDKFLNGCYHHLPQNWYVFNANGLTLVNVCRASKICLCKKKARIKRVTS